MKMKNSIFILVILTFFSCGYSKEYLLINNRFNTMFFRMSDVRSDKLTDFMAVEKYYKNIEQIFFIDGEIKGKNEIIERLKKYDNNFNFDKLNELKVNPDFSFASFIIENGDISYYGDYFEDGDCYFKLTIYNDPKKMLPEEISIGTNKEDLLKIFGEINYHDYDEKWIGFSVKNKCIGFRIKDNKVNAIALTFDPLI